MQRQRKTITLHPAALHAYQNLDVVGNGSKYPRLSSAMNARVGQIGRQFSRSPPGNVAGPRSIRITTVAFQSCRTPRPAATGRRAYPRWRALSHDSPRQLGMHSDQAYTPPCPDRPLATPLADIGLGLGVATSHGSPVRPHDQPQSLAALTIATMPAFRASGGSG